MQRRARESMSWFAMTNTHARINTGVRFDTRLCPHTDQQLILKGMLAASPAIYGHVMAQMISNPSLPIHTANLPSQAKLLDANTRLLVTQGHYPSFNECVPGHTKTGGDCNKGLTSVLRKHNMKVTPSVKFFWTQTLLATCTPTSTPRGTRGGL